MLHGGFAIEDNQIQTMVGDAKPREHIAPHACHDTHSCLLIIGADKLTQTNPKQARSEPNILLFIYFIMLTWSCTFTQKYSVN